MTDEDLDGAATDAPVVEARRAQRVAEERFARAFRTAPIPFVIRRIADDRIVEANAQFEALTGLSREELLGMTAGEVLGRIAVQPGEDRQAQIAARRELIARAEATGSVSNAELSLKTQGRRTQERARVDRDHRFRRGRSLRFRERDRHHDAATR